MQRRFDCVVVVGGRAGGGCALALRRFGFAGRASDPLIDLRKAVVNAMA